MSTGYEKDDSGLVGACLRKNHSAWAVFAKKYSGLIGLAAKKRLEKYGLASSPEDIEDIRQDVLGSIWKTGKLATVSDRSDISSWLAVVSANAAIAHARKRRTQEGPDEPVSIFETVDDRELCEFIPAPANDLKDELARKDLSEKIGRAIEALPKKEKLAIKLNLFHGKKYHQIARIMSLPPGTVSSYIKRAKERLRAAVSDGEGG